MTPLIIGGKAFTSRLFLGTGKFSSSQALNAAIITSGSELVTVALRRVDVNDDSDDIISAIPKNVTIMLNTSGARNCADALKIARFGRAAGYEWIKLEIHPDPRYLLPDPIETYNAAVELVKDGFKVLPYINADPVLAKRLEDIGVHAVMPLGSPIGSNQGIQTEAMLRIIIEQANIPVVIDAGLGLPSHAAHAIELGADAVLVNTAIAAANDPGAMAKAFAMATEAAEMALKSGPPAPQNSASATSPLDTFSDII